MSLFTGLDEYNYVSNLTNIQFWIGLVDEGYFYSNGDENAINGNYIWIDDNNFDFLSLPNNWASPSSIYGSNEFCGQVETNNDLNEIYCESDWQHYILEVPYNLQNSNNCDSVAVLNLTINQPDTSITEVTTCDSYYWGDSTYTQSGTYSYTGGSVTNNYSISLDGNNDYINGNLYNNFNNELSVGLWFKSNQLGQDCKLIYTGSWVNWSTRNFGIQHTNNGVKFILSIQGNNQYWVETGSNYINDNLWHNVFATYDNNYIRLYIDGQIIDSLHVVGNINNVNDLFIGTRNPLGEYFNGNLDELQLWNKALNQSEIEQLINCPPIGNESGLVGYWNFEEGSGNTVLDLTVNGNDGTINGANFDNNKWIPAQ